jgi:hypothetical protein
MWYTVYILQLYGRNWTHWIMQHISTGIAMNIHDNGKYVSDILLHLWEVNAVLILCKQQNYVTSELSCN